MKSSMIRLSVVIMMMCLVSCGGNDSEPSGTNTGNPNSGLQANPSIHPNSGSQSISRPTLPNNGRQTSPVLTTVALVYDQSRNQMAFITEPSRLFCPPIAPGDLTPDELIANISPQLTAAFPTSANDLPNLRFIGETQRDSIKVQVFYWENFDLPRGAGQSGAALMVFDDAGAIATGQYVANPIARQALHALVIDSVLIHALHANGYTLPGARPSGIGGFHNLLRMLDPAIDVSQYPDV